METKKGGRISKEDPVNREIMRLYLEEKASISEVGRRVGLSNVGVYYRLVRLGVEMRTTTQGQGRFRWARENHLFSITKLTTTASRSKGAILAAIERAGVEVKEWGNWRFIREEDVQRVLQESEEVYRLEAFPWKDAGVSEGEMGWLGGIWDGEGTISLSFKETKRGPQWNVAISVANTDQRMIEKVDDLLGQLKIDFNRSESEARKKGNRKAFRIHLRGCVSFWRFCREVGPFMVNKAERAAIMMEFAEKQAANASRDGFWKVAQEYAEKFDVLPDISLRRTRGKKTA